MNILGVSKKDITSISLNLCTPVDTNGLIFGLDGTARINQLIFFNHRQNQI